MATLTIDIPESALAAMHDDPASFSAEMRLAAAASWYKEGKISQEIAASIAGLDRVDFLLALARLGQDSFQVDFADLDRELSRG
jgi:predicted HTH domain antitoxin